MLVLVGTKGFQAANSNIVPLGIGAKKLRWTVKPVLPVDMSDPSCGHVRSLFVDMSDWVPHLVSTWRSAAAIRQSSCVCARLCAGSGFGGFHCRGVQAANCAGELPENTRCQLADLSGADARNKVFLRVKFAIKNLDLLATAGIKARVRAQPE